MRRDIALAALGAALLLAGCRKEQEKEAEPVVPVQVAEARQDSIRRMITGDGILRALDQSALTPKISAPVRVFYVNRGDHVRKEQVVAVLENRDLTASVQDAKGAFDQASAQYRNVAAASVPDEIVKAQQDVDAAKQAVDASKQVLDSRRQLFKEGALARKLVDDAAVTYAQAASQYETARKHLESLQSVGKQEEIKSAEGQMLSAKGKYEAAEAQLSYSEIRSPIAGVVADRPLFPGEMASAGVPLMTVMDISQVIARVNLTAAQAAYVHVGAPATITATDTGIQATGKVTVVSPAVDPASTTVEVWVQAANPGEKLRPGGAVHVSILAETIPRAVVIPADAILPSQAGGTVVMVVGQDSVAHERKVTIGAREPEKVQILEGVSPGDRVITVGGLGLQDGGKVKVEQAAAEKASEHE